MGAKTQSQLFEGTTLGFVVAFLCLLSQVKPLMAEETPLPSAKAPPLSELPTINRSIPTGEEARPLVFQIVGDRFKITHVEGEYANEFKEGASYSQEDFLKRKQAADTRIEKSHSSKK